VLLNVCVCSSVASVKVPCSCSAGYAGWVLFWLNPLPPALGDQVVEAELSMGWVDPWVGFSWVGLGRDFSVFRGLGWVGSTIAKVGAY